MISSDIPSSAVAAGLGVATGLGVAAGLGVATGADVAVGSGVAVGRGVAVGCGSDVAVGASVGATVFGAGVGVPLRALQANDTIINPVTIQTIQFLFLIAISSSY